MQTNWLVRAFFCLSLLVAFASNSYAARGMWGSKRKRDEDEDVDDISGGVGAGFETRHKMASNQKQTQKGSAFDSFNSLAGVADSGMGETIESMLNIYLTMMEELVESPEFESMVTPEAVAALLEQIPGLSSSPEVAAMLDSPALKDPSMLKQTILQGMQAIRGYTAEIVDFFNSPEKIRMVLEQLPEEVKGPLNTLMQGDKSGIREMLTNIPGMGSAQIEMLMNLLDGNMEAMASSVKKIISDPTQTEAARQQFLNNPGMAEMFGISEEVLNDKEQFDALMKKGTDAMIAGGSASESDEIKSVKGRTHKGASMSA